MIGTKIGLVVTFLCLLATVIIGCQPAPVPVSPPVTPPSILKPQEPARADNLTVVKPGEPALSVTLKRGCQSLATTNFDSTGLGLGETAVNFTLRDIQGREVRLSRLLTEKPAVVIFGSFT